MKLNGKLVCPPVSVQVVSGGSNPSAGANKLKTMRPRIRKGILVTSTTLSRRTDAFKNVIEVTYKPLIFGNKIVSEKVLGTRTKIN